LTASALVPDVASIFTDMDAEIDTLEARLAKARQLKQGMTQSASQGGFDQTPPPPRLRMRAASVAAGADEIVDHVSPCEVGHSTRQRRTVD
jgi:hypothetical protein